MKRCFAPFKADCPCGYCKKARNLIKKSTLKEAKNILIKMLSDYGWEGQEISLFVREWEAKIKEVKGNDT